MILAAGCASARRRLRRHAQETITQTHNLTKKLIYKNQTAITSRNLHNEKYHKSSAGAPGARNAQKAFPIRNFGKAFCVTNITHLSPQKHLPAENGVRSTVLCPLRKKEICPSLRERNRFLKMERNPCFSVSVFEPPQISAVRIFITGSPPSGVCSPGTFISGSLPPSL